MTQSAMSRLVKSLEDEMGVTLLHRKGKTIAMTTEGRLFYEHAKKILANYALLEQDLGAATRTAKGALRLGASRTPGLHLLPQALYDFSKAHPAIRIDLTVCKTSSVLRDLRDNRIDMGIVEGAITAHDLTTEAIADDDVVIIAPEDHALAKKKSIAVQDLINEPFILPDPGSGTRELVDDFFRTAGIDAKSISVRMTLGSPELIVQMVQAGLGIAFASKWSIFTAVKEGTVKVLKVPARKIARKFYLVSAPSELATPARTFREFIKQYSFFAPF